MGERRERGTWCRNGRTTTEEARKALSQATENPKKTLGATCNSQKEN